MNNLFFILCFLFFGSPLFAQENFEVLLKTGTTLFPENAKTYHETATIEDSEFIDGYYYRLLQFDVIPNEQLLKKINSAGINLLEYIPTKTYVAGIPASFDLESLAPLRVRSIAALPKDLKIDNSLKTSYLPDWATHRDQVQVLIAYYRNLRHDDILNYAVHDGIQILQENGHNNILLASIPKTEIEKIATLPYVAHIGLRPAPDVKDDFEARSLHRVNAIDVEYSGGRHYNGEGVGVLCRDDGAVGPHIDFHGRIFQFENTSTGTHGDGVSGIMAGAGNLNPTYKGNAWGSDLYVTNYEATFLDNTLDLFFDNDVLVTNSSYSNGCNDGYTETAVTVDQQSYDNPTLLHVFSGGNSNNNDCGYGAGDQWGNITGGHKQGKNVIATANLFSDGDLANSSSRGPAHDGRIKPDISANGQLQVSTNPDNTYGEFGGTSGAAPNIAGITAILHQAHRELYNGETANAGLLKAIMLNTANDMGNPGPDFSFGWGHINAYRALLSIENQNWLSDEITQDGVNQHSFTIPENVAEARIMTYWLDPAGSLLTNKALVNDLNSSMTLPDGTLAEPWVLDETPDEATLALPATTGVDDLNNMEQILLSNPTAGTYVLNVEGFEIPFGTHEYFVVWEYRMKDVEVIYPLGGEGFEPGSFERIHWDAHGDYTGFDVEYSTDNGASWTLIDQVGGSTRMLDWDVPNDITSGQMLMRVTANDGTAGVSDTIWSIAATPTNISTGQICPDYIEVIWDAMDDAASYDIYLLGEKFMEVEATANTNSIQLPVDDPTQFFWLAVDATYNNGAKSRRSVAVPTGGGLNDCQQENDLTNNQILSPAMGASLNCESPFTGTVALEFTNNGSLAQANPIISYQVEDDPILSDTLDQTIQPGETVQVTLDPIFTITENGIYQLKAWVDGIGENFPQDDTLTSNFTVYASNGVIPDVIEDFENDDFPKPFWSVENPDDGVTWETSQVIGIDDNPSEVVLMNFYGYPEAGQFDYFYMEPMDFSGITDNLGLTFDVAYSPWNQFEDRLFVEISTDCGATFSEVIYDKEGTELSTVITTNNFIPNESSDWRTEVIDLNGYIGLDKVVIRFGTENGYGNNLFIDNINVIGNAVLPPVASFIWSPTEPCLDEVITFESTSTGADIDSYSWFFGATAVPSTATGPGPHQVVYPLIGGNQTVELTVTNDAGENSTTESFEVNSPPSGSFDFVVGNDGGVVFNATVSNTTSVSWDFGNGTASNDEDVSMEYDEPGIYTVTLTLTNEFCTTIITEEVEVISTSTNVIQSVSDISIFPNPNDGTFNIAFDQLQSNTELTIELADISGRVIESIKWTTSNDQDQVIMGDQNLPAGLYFLRIRDVEDSFVTKIVVE